MIDQILYYLSDEFINQLIGEIATNYKVVAAIIGGPIIYYAAKLVKVTPWKSDDEIVDIVEKKLGLKK